MTREEKLQKAHQMFDDRKLLIELKWQREYFKRGYVSSQEELFNLWIFDECIKALQEPCEDAISRKALIERINNAEENFKADNMESVGSDDGNPFVDGVLSGIFNIREMVIQAPSLKPQEPRWIPVSERLPEELEPVNVTWINHNPESYYADIKDKPFTATGVYFNGQWYWWSTLCTDILAEYSHNYDDIIDDDIEITAWMPLPKPYKADRREEE